MPRCEYKYYCTNIEYTTTGTIVYRMPYAHMQMLNMHARCKCYLIFFNTNTNTNTIVFVDYLRSSLT